jgi:hypothetical protein
MKYEEARNEANRLVRQAKYEYERAYICMSKSQMTDTTKQMVSMRPLAK